MLYKKYHRNFVRKFKKGFKFKLVFVKRDLDIYEVTANPFILEGDDIMPTCIQVPVTKVKVAKVIWSKIILVYPGGRIDRRIKIIEEDAVQKIS